MREQGWKDTMLFTTNAKENPLLLLSLYQFGSTKIRAILGYLPLSSKILIHISCRPPTPTPINLHMSIEKSGNDRGDRAAGGGIVCTVDTILRFS